MKCSHDNKPNRIRSVGFFVLYKAIGVYIRGATESTMNL